MTTVEIEEKERARDLMQRFRGRLPGFDAMNLETWFRHDLETVSIAYVRENGNLVSFALMHQMDFDPWGSHSKPVLMDLIFTKPSCRDQGTATAILEHLMAKGWEITALCNGEKSKEFFVSRGYKHVDMYLGASPVVRKPH